MTFCLCCQAQLFAQKTFEVKGIVTDQEENTLIAATVVLMNLTDSSFADYGLTTESGKFRLEAKKDIEYEFQISYVGYAPFVKKVMLDKNLDLGSIKMEEASNMLDAVQIEADHIPIRMNGDTLEFNSSAFNVQAHDDVEKLLEQMPGVEIEEDGTVKINGKKVEKILVDGKEFFGEDVQTALKNLPADAIKKVEVFDKKTDKEELTGSKSKDENKTINLTLKEDKKVGYMGNVEGGYGYSPPQEIGMDEGKHRYQGSLSLNYFNPKMRVSVIGAANNVNKSGFSYKDFQGMTGGYDNFMSNNPAMSIGSSWSDPVYNLIWNGSSGETRAISGGINMNFFPTDKTDISVHYMYTNADRLTENRNYLRSITPENFYTRNTNTTNMLLAQRHVFNTKFTHKFDSTQELRFRFKLKATSSDDEANRYSETLGQNDTLENVLNQITKSKEMGLGLISNLYYQKKFKKKGRSFSANIAGAYTNNNDVFDNFSSTKYYQGEVISQIDSLNQYQGSLNGKHAFGAEVSYTEPLGEKNLLDFRLIGGFSNESNDRSAFDIIEEVEIPNPFLTDVYQKHYNFQQFVTEFKHEAEKITFTAELGIKRSALEGTLASAIVPINQEYYYPTGSIGLELKPNKTHTYSLYYNTTVEEPRLEQLQPMLNNQNPLTIRLGNPNLIPEYNHNVWMSYRFFDQTTFTSFYVNSYFYVSQNSIISSQEISDAFVSTFKPVNMGESYNGGLNLGYNTTIKKVIKVNMRGGMNMYSNPILLNGEGSSQFNHNYNAFLSIGNKKKKIVDFNVSANVRLGNTIYSRNSSLNVTYLQHNYTARFRVTIAKKWNIKTNFSYRVYDDMGYDETLAVPIWSAGLSRTFLKGDQLKIELSAENLMNEAYSVHRYSWNGNITENQTNLMGRYFMLSVAYKINKMGANKPEAGGDDFIIMY